MFTHYFTQDGNTALMRASVSGQYDVVNLLLANGAQLDLQNQVG